MASSSATVAVEKATSDLLLGSDWTMNIEICDSINSHQWQSKDVVKAVKKRLQHKSSKVQLLALTLLETMVKNCGDFVHFQIAERNILEEMIKIVRKKADMQVRDKILVLLDSWQEAFGGPAGKYPQYYWAYEELRRSRVVFPKRSPDAAPIFTPPPTHATLRHMQAGYGMPNNSLTRFDETIATETENLSLSSLDSMRHVMEVLGDMLQALNPSDHEALKDEVIVDLVGRCQTNLKKLMQMLTTTGDEELLGRGLELNDSMQSLLARHDAIASGTPLPTQDASSSSQSTEAGSSSFNANEIGGSSPRNSGPTPKDPSAPLSSITRGQIEEDEEEDEFAQLARRHSKTQTVPPKDATTGSGAGSISMNTSNVPEPSVAIPSNALAVVNPPAPVNTSKEQDIIDLLSMTLSTSSVSSETQQTPAAAEEMHQASVPSSSEGYPYASQTYSGNSSYNTYVVPWAQQPQSIQSQPQPQSHLQNQHLPYSVPQQKPQPVHVLQPQVQSPLQNQHLQYSAPQPESHLQNQQHLQYTAPQQQLQPQHKPQQFQSQVQSQPQPQQKQQLHNQHLLYPSTYPPPPWAATPRYPTNQNQISATNTFSTPRANATAASYTPAQGVRLLQQNNAFPSGGDPQWNSGARNPASATGQKPFIPSYRLFEDLNVFGNTDGRIKMSNSGTSSSLSGTMGPGMVGGRK